MDHLQDVHPLVVHFPVALLPTAAAVYFLTVAIKRDSLAWTGMWMLVLGAIGAAVAVTTGLLASESVMVSTSVRAHLLNPHRNIMLAVLSLSIIAAAWAIIARPMPARGRLGFLAILLVIVGLIVKGADYGGRMVYDYNAGGNACGQPIDFTK
ncbi:MAG: DUF2231 domain-containing protein [Candidatus Binataceae bacterium]|nr:DUF2231 domain-containing protein [Candidatus Binataceae bacterium]